MNNVITLVSEYLRRHELKFQIEDGCLSCGVDGQHGHWSMLIDTDESGRILSVVSPLPIPVPAAQRDTWATELARLNFGQRLGQWLFDMDGGQMMHCVSTPAASLETNLEGSLEVLLAVSVSSVDDMFSRVAEKAFGGSLAVQGKPSAAVFPEPRGPIGFNCRK